ncbi:MAG: DUF4242 domain-containing protein [Planctomycetaceae bacterium]
MTGELELLNQDSIHETLRDPPPKRLACSPADLQAAAERSRAVGDGEMADEIRWIRSYVLDEAGGGVGTVCIYEAASEEAIRRHADRADLPVDEVIPIADTVVVRPDPAS